MPASMGSAKKAMDCIILFENLLRLMEMVAEGLAVYKRTTTGL